MKPAPHLPQKAMAKEDSEDEAPSKGSGLAPLYMPAAASSKEDDPVYNRHRLGEGRWPSTIGSDGQVRPLKYTGNGWPMQFANPDRPRAPFNLKDAERVCVLSQQGMRAPSL
jgi:hypothetical protein